MPSHSFEKRHHSEVPDQFMLDKLRPVDRNAIDTLVLAAATLCKRNIADWGSAADVAGAADSAWGATSRATTHVPKLTSGT